MTDHIKIRQNLKNIKTIKEFENLLQKYVLTDEEKQILRMHYISGKNLLYISDVLGYSESTIKRRHKKSLQKLSELYK